MAWPVSYRGKTNDTTMDGSRTKTPEDDARDGPAGEQRAYREFSPPERLRGLVECFWRRDAGSAPSLGWILPDGCIDIIWMGDQPPFVAGPATRATRAEIAAGSEIVGVRFRPGAAPGLLGVDARELLNRDVPLRDIWPREQTTRWHEAMDHPNTGERLERIAASIAARHALRDVSDPFMRRVVAWIVRHPRGDLDEMARFTGLSDRQIRRRVGPAVGYGPKTLQRVLRMQRLLWLAEAAGEGG